MTLEIFWEWAAVTAHFAPVLVLHWIVISGVAPACVLVAVFAQIRRQTIPESSCVFVSLSAVEASVNIDIGRTSATSSCLAGTVCDTGLLKPQGFGELIRAFCGCAQSTKSRPRFGGDRRGEIGSLESERMMLAMVSIRRLCGGSERVSSRSLSDARSIEFIAPVPAISLEKSVGCRRV